MMKRRSFITLLGGAAAWPLAAHAQQPMPVSGSPGALGDLHPMPVGLDPDEAREIQHRIAAAPG